jgi:hypothetical protein
VPTASDRQSGIHVHGEILMLCREETSDADCSLISKALSAELDRAGMRALGSASPYLSGGGLFGVATDASTTVRTGTATGVIADF